MNLCTILRRSVPPFKILGSHRQFTSFANPCAIGGSPDQLYKDLQLQRHPIEDGYGEFIIHSKTQEKISRDVFSAVYTEMEKYRSHLGENLDRPHQIRQKIEKIDSTLDISFLPRTLYELLYIRAAIQEELNDGKICPLQTKDSHNAFTAGDWKLPIAKLENCWHLCRFGENAPPNSQDENLRFLAFRLNALAEQTFHPKQHFTGIQITSFVEKEVAYLKKHRETFSTIFHKTIKSFCGCRGGAINFGLAEGNGARVFCYPMGIRNNRDAQMILNAVALECNEAARNAHILYRGGDLFTPDHSTSICWGTSLFGGAFLDGTACVFHYATAKNRTAHALIIPKKDTKAPFYIPSLHPIRHLFSMGEFHHGRSLVSKHSLDTVEHIKGIHGLSLAEIPSFIYSEMNPENLQYEIAKYHKKAIPLSPPVENET